MKKSVLVLASLVSIFAVAPAFALVQEGNPDGMYVSLMCSNPNVRDAGLKVTISYGGISPHYAADVSEITIAGSKTVLAVSQVTSTYEGTHKIFTDSETQGNKFRLVYNPAYDENDSPVSFNSTLVIHEESKDEALGITTSTTTTAELNCQGFSHPM